VSSEKDLKPTLIWLLATVVALGVALSSRGQAFIDGHYLPVGNDSFYHARRILDLIADPSSLHEYDHLIHYPEGSLLIWPWGYDFLMSVLVRIGLALHLGKTAIGVLVHIPVVAFPMCLALVALICRQLRISLAGTFVALLATALFPLNQGLYGVGDIDHHFAEQILVLSSIACGLAWMGRPDSTWRAAVAGGVIGLSVCIHNGLFIVQFPLAAVLLWTWLRGRALPSRTWVFAVALVTGTTLAAAPSEAFRQGAFEFYELSWFHIYFSACVAAACAFMSRFPRSPRNIAILAVGGIAMLVPVVSQLQLADRFLSVSVQGAEDIAEQQSVWGLVTRQHRLSDATGLYSLLVILLPFAFVACAYRIWKAQDLQRLLFWVSSLFGLALLSVMVRMHVFGSFALSLVWIALFEELVAEGRMQAQAARFAYILLFLGAVASVPAFLGPTCIRISRAPARVRRAWRCRTSMTVTTSATTRTARSSPTTFC
jgi:asparagine N-glycosylation enzyme membrane subunit Stt3